MDRAMLCCLLVIAGTTATPAVEALAERPGISGLIAAFAAEDRCALLECIDSAGISTRIATLGIADWAVPEQRRQFARALGLLVQHDLASLLDEAVRPLRCHLEAGRFAGDTAMVRLTVHDADDAEWDLLLDLRQRGGRWRLVDSRLTDLGIGTIERGAAVLLSDAWDEEPPSWQRDPAVGDQLAVIETLEAAWRWERSLAEVQEALADLQPVGRLQRYAACAIAQAAWSEARHAEGIAALHALPAEERDDPTVAWLTANLLAELDRPAETLAAADRFLAIWQGDERLELLAAQACRDLDRQDETTARLRRLLDRRPDAGEALALLGDCLGAAGAAEIGARFRACADPAAVFTELHWHWQVRRDRALFEACIDHLTATHPDHDELSAVRVALAATDGRIDEALALLVARVAALDVGLHEADSEDDEDPLTLRIVAVLQFARRHDRLVEAWRLLPDRRSAIRLLCDPEDSWRFADDAADDADLGPLLDAHLAEHPEEAWARLARARLQTTGAGATRAQADLEALRSDADAAVAEQAGAALARLLVLHGREQTCSFSEDPALVEAVAIELLRCGAADALVAQGDRLIAAAPEACQGWWYRALGQLLGARDALGAGAAALDLIQARVFADRGGEEDMELVWRIDHALGLARLLGADEEAIWGSTGPDLGIHRALVAVEHGQGEQVLRRQLERRRQLGPVADEDLALAIDHLQALAGCADLATALATCRRLEQTARAAEDGWRSEQLRQQRLRLLLAQEALPEAIALVDAAGNDDEELPALLLGELARRRDSAGLRTALDALAPRIGSSDAAIYRAAAASWDDDPGTGLEILSATAGDGEASWNAKRLLVHLLRDAGKLADYFTYHQGGVPYLAEIVGRVPEHCDLATARRLARQHAARWDFDDEPWQLLLDWALLDDGEDLPALLQQVQDRCKPDSSLLPRTRHLATIAAPDAAGPIARRQALRWALGLEACNAHLLGRLAAVPGADEPGLAFLHEEIRRRLAVCAGRTVDAPGGLDRRRLLHALQTAGWGRGVIRRALANGLTEDTMNLALGGRLLAILDDDHAEWYALALAAAANGRAELCRRAWALHRHERGAWDLGLDRATERQLLLAHGAPEDLSP